LTPPIVRPAARVVILDPDDNILLQQVGTKEGWRGWITPGGGIEEGESAETAALRELVEEVGLQDMELGPEIWTRRHVFVWNGIEYDQRERFFLARVHEPVEPVPGLDAEVLALQSVLGQRWWKLDEVEALQTAPRNLVRLVRDILDRGPPPSPIDVGV
jgi:ADP-ribose pyrophosphatase YjhB (NUDIX family)